MKNQTESLEEALKLSEKQQATIKEVEFLITEWINLSPSEQIKRRDGVISDLAFLSEPDRRLCVEHLAGADICKGRETLEKIRTRAKQLGIDKEETTTVTYPTNLTLLTPAQDVIRDTAYVTVPVKLLINNKIETVLYLITSGKEEIRLTEDDLLRLELYSERKPVLTSRWSDKSRKSYLNREEQISITQVFEEIYRLCKGYIDFGNDIWSKYISVWIIGTYFHRMFQTYPYVHLHGDMESGKTKTLTFVAWLSFNGELTFNSSPAYVVRAVHNNHSTCCIDEVERLRRSDDQDSQLVIAMYNSGYKKGSYCGKVEQSLKNGQFLLSQFEAYAPKMFASIRGLDSSLGSRCIPITMLNTGNKEIKNTELNSDDFKFQAIRDHLYLVMLSYFKQIRIYYQTLKDEEILGREWELWKPILAIAKEIDTDNSGQSSLYYEIRNHALEIQKLKKEARKEEASVPKVLSILKEALATTISPSGEDFWQISELLDFLKNSDEEEFEWLKDEKQHNKGRWLGDILRKAGIVKGRAEQRRAGNKNAKGYCITLEKIEERLKNYEV